jgi:hypothetical protein
MLRIVEEGDEGSKQVEEGDEGRRMCGGMYYDRCSGVMSAVGLLQKATSKLRVTNMWRNKFTYCIVPLVPPVTCFAKAWTV